MAEARFLDLWAKGGLAHAWLVTGPPGVGKATLARRLARTVLSDPARDEAGSAQGDLLVIGEEQDGQPSGGDILIEDARSIGLFLRRTAVRGGWRVVIVRRAERLNRNAANALLKLLEEPPQKVLILLTCNAPGRLLPTIRSRCQSVRLPPLGDDAMRQLVGHLCPDLDEVRQARIASLSGGSPGRALALIRQSALQTQTLVDRVLASPAATAGSAAYEVADAVLSLDGGFSDFFGLLSQTICSTIRSAAADTSAAAGGPAHSLLAVRPAGAWADICLGLGRLHGEAERLNLDKRQAILSGLGLLSG